MKLTFLTLIVFFSFSLIFSQIDKTVTLTLSAQGQTINEAKQRALRDAIEQAFGVFVSSNTEIVNDELLKDEIVSVSNGNIQDYDVISLLELPNGGYATTLKATVSISKLTSFAANKGANIEFKGSLFAFNVNQQILNEKNELKAIEDVCQVIKNIADVSFDYSIKASDPISLDASNSKWRIPLYVSVHKNINFDNIAEILYSTLKGVSLSLTEAKNYLQLGKSVYPISIALNENDYDYILLRSDASISRLLEMLYYFNHSLQNFKISNGIAEWTIKDNPKNLKYIYDYGFRLFIKKMNNGSDWNAYCKASVFYTHCSPRQFCNVGEAKDFLQVNNGTCEFNPGSNPILDHKNWFKTKRVWNGRTYVNLTGVSITKDFQTALTTNRSNVGSWDTRDVYFTNQFSFVKNLENEMLNNVSGLIISFIPSYYENSQVLKQPLASVENIHVVSKGETLFAITKKYGVTFDQLKELNPTISGSLTIGDKIIVPNSSSKENIIKSTHIELSPKKKDLNKELVRFYYEDIRDINEINKITQYKVFAKPIKIK